MKLLLIIYSKLKLLYFQINKLFLAFEYKPDFVFLVPIYNILYSYNKNNNITF